MRVLPHHPVLHGRRRLAGLKVAAKGLALVGVVAVAGSCARFPANSAGNFTAITFSFTVAGKINTTLDDDPNTYYIYDVALAAISNPSPLISTAPLPVINSSNPNGRVAGSPTHFIEFNSLNPQSPQPFQLNRFALQTEVPNPNDPNNPINIAVWAPSTRGTIFNYTSYNPGDNMLTFTVYTNELVDSDAQALSLKFLQVNILTMTRLANQGSGARVIDALGNSQTVSGLNNFLTIDLRTSHVYQNSVLQLEPTGDTYGGTEPDVDISDFTITVQSVTGQGSGVASTPL